MTIDDADRLYRAGEFEQAADGYQHVLSQGPNRRALFRLGLCRFVLGAKPAAAQLFEQVLSADPHDPNAATMYGASLEAAVPPGDSERWYRTAITSKLPNGVASVNMAYQQLLRGSPEIAVRVLSAGSESLAFEIPGEAVLPTFSIQRLPRKSNPRRDQFSAIAAVMLGARLQNYGRFVQARECFQYAIRMHPRYGAASYGLAHTSTVRESDTDLIGAIERSVKDPLIADHDFKVAKLYGMLPADVSGDPKSRTPADNQTVRNVFVIGPDKKIKLVLVYPMTTGRNFDEVLRVVDSLQLTAKHKVATPANWKQGEDVVIAGSVSNDQAKELFGEWEQPKPYIRIVPQPK